MKPFCYRDIISLIPDERLEEFARLAKVDYKVSKLRGKDIFNLLLYSVLEKHELSLRTIEENYSVLFRSKTRHSSIASRLETISVDYFSSIFNFLAAKFVDLDTQKKLAIIDSTTMQLSSKLLKFGVRCGNKNGLKKKSIKCTVVLKNNTPKHFDLHIEQKDSGDTTLFRKMILEHAEDEIWIFDRGLQKRKTFEEFEEKNISFITRGNDNIRHKVKEIKEIISKNYPDDLEILEDAVVHLGAKSARFSKSTIRLIKAKDRISQKIYIFLTNMMELTSDEVCTMYKKRWSIEVFFRFVKQELNMKHFLGHNRNTILVHLYMVLIASILLIEYIKRTKILSYKFARRSFIREVFIEVFKPIIEYSGGDKEKIYLYFSSRKEQLHASN